MEKNLRLRTETKGSLKPELKMKVVRNTCDKEIGGEMKSFNEHYVNKTSLVNFQKYILPFREIYVKYSEIKSTAIGIVFSYIT